MEETERKQLKLIIVYGTNKDLEVERTESIARVKLGAMGLFGIPEAEQGSYILKTKVDGQEVQLDEAKTVDYYHLHEDQKVTLAAGAPYG